MSESAKYSTVVVRRGSGIEARHKVSIAVVDSESIVTHFSGDSQMVTFTRSSIKPFQAIALLTSGAADHYGLTEKELALCCGSHNGSDEHRALAESILSKAGNSASDLQCGSHWPTGLRQKGAYPLADEDKDSLRNNCSGKHAGFLALCRHLDDDPTTYLETDSRTQTMVRQEMSQALGVDLDTAPSGIDGCSAPNYAIPLFRLGGGFARLATATEGPLARIAGAMRAYPEMVSGEGRFDLALARTFPDNAICKVGAEALEVIAFRDQAIAVVVKVHDGSIRALSAACVAVLRELGLLKDVNLSLLEKFTNPKVKNHRGASTGEIVAEINLSVLQHHRKMFQ